MKIAVDPNAALELRGRMNAELAQYLYPKRKAVELATDPTGPVSVVIEYAPTNLDGSLK